MSNDLTLSGIRVLDLGTRVSTAWCTRLFADYGAEVIAVEQEGGHPLRNEGPFDTGQVSIPSRYFLVSKGIADPVDLPDLVANADVIITSNAIGDLGAQELSKANSNALVCAITPHGLDGDLTKRPGNDLTASASSGWAWLNGTKDREPLKGSGYQASYQSGTFAFGATLAALIEQLASGATGQIIDISEREVLVSTCAPAPLRCQYSGADWPRKTTMDVNDGPVPVKDGWFALTISRPIFWIKAMEVLGLPELAADKDLQQAGLRHRHKDRFVDKVGDAMKQWTHRRERDPRSLGGLQRKRAA